jgi:sigma-B regulation protein RsbU (phosphoserine phosphatase)
MFTIDTELIRGKLLYDATLRMKSQIVSVEVCNQPYETLPNGAETLLQRKPRTKDNRLPGRSKDQEDVTLDMEQATLQNQSSPTNHNHLTVCNEMGNSMISVESRISVEGEYLFASPPLDFCLGALTGNKPPALEHDLAQAVITQRALLPRRTSPFNGWQVHYHYAPTAPVGGDCCDLFEYNGDLLFLLGDVSGKGLAASLLMSHLHGTFRALANTDCPLDSMMEAANRIFSQSTQLGQLATLVVGVATREGSIEFVSAGHLPMLHLSRLGVNDKGATAVPLGTFSDTRFQSHRFSLDPGDALLLYSDGLTESCNSAGEEYGIARLREVAAQYHLAAPLELIAGCLSELHSFTRGTGQTDDMTLLVIQRAA